jgi:hypothetical protein
MNESIYSDEEEGSGPGLGDSQSLNIPEIKYPDLEVKDR